MKLALVFRSAVQCTFCAEKNLEARRCYSYPFLATTEKDGLKANARECCKADRVGAPHRMMLAGEYAITNREDRFVVLSPFVYHFLVD